MYVKKSLLLTVSIFLFIFLFSLTTYAETGEELFFTVNVTSEDVNVIDGDASGWETNTNEEFIEDTELFSANTSHAIEFTFKGTTFRWLGFKNRVRGKADIYHNGELLASEIDLYSKNPEYQSIIYEKTFEEGTHTIKIVPTGEKNENSSGEFISVDAFSYVPSLEGLIEKSKNILYDAPKVPEDIGDKLIPYYPKEARNMLIEKIAGGLFANEQEDVGEKEEAVAELIKAIEKYEESIIIPGINDLTENNYNGEVISAILAEGKMDHALRFDGKDDYVELPDDLNILDGNHNLSVEAWFKPFELPEEDNWAINEGILSFEGENRISFPFGDSNDPESLSVRGNLEESGWTTIVKTPLLEVDKWYHMAATYDPEDGWNLYLDGEKVDSNSITEEFNETSDTSSIGGLTGGENRFFNGLIDEVRIWETTRTGKEIRENMDKELSGEEEGLKAYWSMDDYE
ncbi:MAG: LamG domain-containing protein [Bacillota bacterium]